MRDKFYFLRFVVVLLKILAILVLVGGLAAAIFGFVAAPAGGGTLESILRLAAKIGGILALVGGFFYFIVYWGVSDLIRVQMSIEENTRQTSVDVARLEQVFSAERIGRAVADAVAARVVAERAWSPPAPSGAFRETAVAAAAPPAAAPTAATFVTAQAPAREAQPTVVAPAAQPVVERPTVATTAVREAAPRATEAFVKAIPAEPVIEKVTVVAAPAPEMVARPAEAVEAGVSVAEPGLPEEAEEAIPESAAMLEEQAEAAVAPVEAVEQPVREDRGRLPDDARVMTWTGDEGVEKAVAEELEARHEEAPALAGSVMTWVGDRPAQEERPEAAQVAEAEAAPEGLEPAEAAGVEMEEARARAKEVLDRSLGEAARQMAELEGPVTVVAPPEGAEDNLAEIAGIGPVFRVRLRQAGITTFAALAAMTPTQLAAITEQTVERITRDDWIGQAERRLAVG